jgi:toxin-antitoxin system PIN domain toxin
VIVDANVLLYAADADSPFHAPAHAWLLGQLEGDRRLGIPWPTIVAFLRISTHPRASRNPIPLAQAWESVEGLLEHEVVWIPEPTSRHAAVVGHLLTSRPVSGNLVPDAHLAALAIEHGVSVASADSDFARFPEVRWVHPLS